MTKKMLIAFFCGVIATVVLAAAGDVVIKNSNVDKDINFTVNDGGVIKTPLSVVGSTGTVTAPILNGTTATITTINGTTFNGTNANISQQVSANRLELPNGGGSTQGIKFTNSIKLSAASSGAGTSCDTSCSSSDSAACLSAIAGAATVTTCASTSGTRRCLCISTNI